MASMRIGLTGGIGSGKSTVATIFVAQGAKLIDTDAIARSMCEPGGSAMKPLESAFGPAVMSPDGGLDRARMRERVFTDPDAKRRLEAILHPLIGLECERHAADGVADAIVFDVPLLVESRRWRARVDRVLVVDCSESTQVDRVVTRSAWPADTVRQVIAQQAQRRARRAAADAVIFNEGLALDELSDLVRSLWRQWLPASTR